MYIRIVCDKIQDMVEKNFYLGKEGTWYGSY